VSIDEEELRRRLYDRSSTPEEDRDRCPSCDSSCLIPRNRGDPAGGGPPKDSPGRYRCQECGWTGDDPA
jgi:hypothetical protein